LTVAIDSQKVDGDDGRTLLGEADGVAAPLTASGARDKGHLSVQLAHGGAFLSVATAQTGANTFIELSLGR